MSSTVIASMFATVDGLNDLWASAIEGEGTLADEPLGEEQVATVEGIASFPDEAAEALGSFDFGEINDFTCPANPDLWMYRGRTIGLLRRYLILSIETGRLPSLLGREFFRTRVSSYNAATFEDVVIFVHDVERSLERLDKFEQEMIACVVLQEYSQPEAARMLGCGLRTIERRFPEALDHLIEIFLCGGLLRPMMRPNARACGKKLSRGGKPRKSCKLLQAGEINFRQRWRVYPSRLGILNLESKKRKSSSRFSVPSCRS